jgi:hypothetical protein
MGAGFVRRLFESDTQPKPINLQDSALLREEVDLAGFKNAALGQSCPSLACSSELTLSD